MLTLPTPDRVRRWLEQFDADPRIAEADAAVRLVFEQWPGNSRIEEVLAKVVVLNQLYSTQIYATHDVARHSVELGIDGRLRTGDPSLVESIASVTVAGNQRRHNLSFASKYCAWHRPDEYQIFDSYVENLLWVYRPELELTELKRRQLSIWRRIITAT